MALQLTLSILLGLVFSTSSIPKLRHPKGFILTVLEYRVLPPSLGHIYARLLPPLELLIALLLFTGTVVRVAAFCASALFLSFIVATGTNLARGRELDCGYFGAGGGRRTGWYLILQDLGLLSVSIGLAAASKGWTTSAGWSVIQLGGATLRAGLSSLGLCTLVAMSCVILLGRFGGKEGRRRHAVTNR